MIRLTIPSIDAEDCEAVNTVLKTGNLVQGVNVDALESDLAAYIGTKHVVAMNNCTSALLLSLIALGVGKGDVVPVTAYSWIATANVIEFLGARPHFVDIQPDTFNMDPNPLEDTLKRLTKKAVTRQQQIKAMIPVHSFGQVADMEAINSLANKYEVAVIEDAACALGGKYAGKSAGTWGTVGCFSFHPRKTITTGEGGAVSTDDSDVATSLRALRNHGLDPNADHPDFIVPGLNCRITDFQAAMGLTQLAKFERILKARRRLAKRYDSLFKDTDIQPPVVARHGYHAYQSYVVLLPVSQALSRNDVISKLRGKGVETTIGTCHMPMTSYFSRRYGYKTGDFPVTDSVANRSLTLPLYAAMTKEDQETVVHAILGAISDG